jgi:glycine dehydrogenase subunit 1
MLAAIGVQSVDDLFADVPRELRAPPLNIPEGRSELEVLRMLSELAAKNLNVENVPSFLGGGAYQSYVPAGVGAITGRAEFYTSYTPYQPEVSQGTLQVIYEFQSMIAMLTAMDVANASLYDGATAVAEAAAMALNATGRERVAILDSVHPQYRAVLDTYGRGIGYHVDELPAVPRFSIDTVRRALSNEHAALIVQVPDFLGSIIEMPEVVDAVHSSGALLIAVVDPLSLALLAPPGEYGADIAVGEGQSLGGWLNFGGPYLGFIACRKGLERRLPGRIAGATVDDREQKAYVLTLQTREQHIRRERATSNICTNEALVALGATVYMSLLGDKGLEEVAQLCLSRAHYAADRLRELGATLPANAPFFRELAVRLPIGAAEANARIRDAGMIGGVEVGPQYPHIPELQDCLLLAFSENTRRQDIDRLVLAVSSNRSERSECSLTEVSS